MYEAQIQPSRKRVLDQADYTAPTRQHDLDQTNRSGRCLALKYLANLSGGSSNRSGRYLALKYLDTLSGGSMICPMCAGFLRSALRFAVIQKYTWVLNFWRDPRHSKPTTYHIISYHMYSRARIYDIYRRTTRKTTHPGAVFGADFLKK